jgi:hypothetical protein
LSHKEQIETLTSELYWYEKRRYLVNYTGIFDKQTVAKEAAIACTMNANTADILHYLEYPVRYKISKK